MGPPYGFASGPLFARSITVTISPPIFKKHLSQMIGQKISDLSCDKAAFEKTTSEYNQALQRNGFNRTIMYKPSQSFPHRSNNKNMKKRKRNII